MVFLFVSPLVCLQVLLSITCVRSVHLCSFGHCGWSNYSTSDHEHYARQNRDRIHSDIHGGTEKSVRTSPGTNYYCC